MRVGKLLAILALVVWLATPAAAQITIPVAFVNDTPANADEVNQNFNALGVSALNRTGGTITGNIGVASLVTIDGVDVGVQACTTCTPTFATLALSSTSATALDVAGGITAGTGNVAIIDTTGKIPALTTNYFTSLDGSTLTGIAEANITDGSILARVAGTETISGAWTVTPTITLTAGLKEYGRSVVQGAGTAQPYFAANFTASTGTWTVASGDVASMRYREIGRLVSYAFILQNTSVSATPTELRIALPSGPAFGGICFADINENGTHRVGIITASASGYLQIQRADAAAFATSTDTTDVRGTCWYEW